MGISKDLSQTPYFDDYNEDKNFHRVLFKPATAVQARELNQMQTILQDQVERFGENILIDGTIISGGNFIEINPLPFVKVLDNDTDNRPIVLTNYVGLRLRGKTSGVTARVVTFKAGFQSQVNKNTLYVKYTSANATDDQSIFDTAEQIEVLNNDDTIAVTLTVAGTRDANPVGDAYGITCGEGVLFQKGHFIRFYEQIGIVSRYDTVPTGIVIGFKITETVVDSFQDTSLLDNSSGFNNEQAPGADRLKLTPELVVYTLAEAAAVENFFIVQEYQNGRIIRRNDRTKFNSIGQEMSRRTSEESGNYALNPFSVAIDEHPSDTNKVSLGIGSGVGYVEGNRVEVLSELKVDIDKATDSFGVEQQNVTTFYGSYYNLSAVQGGWADLVSEMGLVNLKNGSAATVGTARVRSIRALSDTEWRLYIFDVQGDAVNTAETLEHPTIATTNATISLDQNGNSENIKFPDKKEMVWGLGKSNIKEIVGTPDYTTYAATTLTTTNSTGIGDISPGDWFWRDTAVDSILAKDYIIIEDVSGTIVPSSDITIEQVGTDNETNRAFNVSAHSTTDQSYNVLIPVKRKVTPATKEIETVYVRVDASSHSDLTSGLYSLKVPDALEIKNIWKGSTTSFTVADAATDPSIVNVTNQYKLVRNQKDSYYDFSYIKKKSSAVFSGTDTLLIEVRVFKESGSSTVGYYTVDSYPVDDTTVSETTLKTQDIPSYMSENGIIHSLRDSIDFRPYPSGVAYNTTDAAALVVNDSIETLRAGITFGYPLYAPSPSGVFESDYNYYVARRDKVFIDENGAIRTIQGPSSDIPMPPTDPNKGMVVAEVFVTPFPSLPSSVANRTDHPEYAIGFTKPNNRRYTMKDINGLDKRIKQLEYYTVLNALEKDAEEYIIQDANGLNRFKNGIFVDNFRNLLNADLSDPSFSASVSKTSKELSPRIHQYYLDMKVDSTSNVAKHKDITTLNYGTPEVFLDQPFATKTKSCTTDFYRWTGTMRIYPEYDGGADVTIAPDIQLPDGGLVEAFTGFTEALGELSLFQDQREVLNSTTARLNLGTTSTTSGRTTTTTRTFQNETTTNFKTTTQNMDVSTAEDVTSTVVGDFVTDVSFRPFLRSQDVEIEIFGMMPNKRVYFYFDEVDVNASIAPAQILTDDQLEANEANQIQNRLVRTGKFSSTNAIKANSNGVVRAIFRIPSETFYVGDRKLEVTSAFQYQDVSNAETYAIRTYRGFNFSGSKASLTSAPRMPVFNFNTAETTSTEVTRGASWSTSSSVTQPAPSSGGGGGGGKSDPIAQTFWVDQASTSDTVIQVPSVDVYFSSKSSTGNGVTAQIYETVNGYPGNTMVTYGAARLEASQVNADQGNSGNSLTPTKFTFDNPVTLGVGREYCVIIQPDGNDPDYRVWTAKTGQNDAISGLPVSQNVSAGVLFTSTNKLAWTPYQDENLAMTIYKNVYNVASGTVTLANRDHDFLDISSYADGPFIKNETVFKITSEANRTFSSDTITFTAGSRTATCATSTTFDLVNSGDNIVVDYGVGQTPRYQAFKIEAKGTPSVGGELTLEQPAILSNSDATFYNTVVGTMDYFYESKIDLLARMILIDSSADGNSVDNGDKFIDGDTIRGVESEAYGIVGTVTDLPVNALNMNLYKTDYNRTRTGFKLYKDSSTTEDLTPGITTHLNKSLYEIKSKSNLTSSDIPFKVEVALENLVSSNESKDSSPVFDHEITNAHLVEYVVNNDDTGEEGSQGNADSKYITSMITLASDMDASDLSVLLTAYKPIGTDIKVYGRLQNSADLRSFSGVEWTELEKDDVSNITSSSANRFDFKEIGFRIPEGSAVDAGGAKRVDQDSMNYIIGGSTFTTYKYFAIKIVLTTSEQYSIPRVKDMRAIALA